MKRTRKIVAVLCAVVLLVSLVPSTVLATGEASVVSISAEPITYVQGESGYTSLNEKYYWHYPWHEDMIITIEYSDGSAISGTINSITEQTGDGFYCEEDQPWGVGEHTVSLEYNGATCQGTVIVEDNGIDSISAEPITLQEGTSGYYMSKWDEESGTYIDNYWWCYSYVDDAVYTINYSDGSSVCGTRGEIFDMTGYWVEQHDNQYCDEPWGAGTHIGQIFFMGETCDIEVTVEAAPIKNISASAVSVIEGTNGYFDGHSDPETGEWIDNSWWRYSTYGHDAVFTITNADDTVTTCSYWDIYDTYGADLQVYDDQAYENQWGVGTHKATISLFGVEGELEVNITESPIKSIEAKPITLVEKMGGINDGHSDPETGDWIENSWYRYELNAIYTITLSDGTVIEGDNNAIYNELEEWVNIEDDQSYENQWGVGKHTATASIFGVTCEVEVEVKASPVASISFTKLPDDNKYYENEYVDLTGAVLRVNFTDNTYEELEITRNTLVYPNNRNDAFHCETLDTDFSITATHKNGIVTVSALGKEATFGYSQLQTPTAISISENADKSIVITFTRADGTTYDAALIDIGVGGGDGDDVSIYQKGTIFTSDGCFGGGLTYYFDGGLKLKLNVAPDVYLESNILEDCEWGKVVGSLRDAQEVFCAETDYRYFDGTVTKENIDEFLEVAMAVKGSSWRKSPIVIDSTNKPEYTVSASGVKEYLSEFFNVELDLTLCDSYDATNNTVKIKYHQPGDFTLCPRNISYMNGEWTISADYGNLADGFESVTLKMNGDAKITKFYWGEEPAPENPLGITVNGVEARPGDTVEIIYSMDEESLIKSVGINEIVYDENALELTGGKWLLADALLKDFNISNKYGAVAFSENTAVSGQFLKLTFKVKESAPEGNFTVAAAVAAKVINEEGEEIAYDIDKQISEVTITHIMRGDLNEDERITSDDAIYLLYHTLYSDQFKLNQDGNFDKLGGVTSDDAIYLLYYTLYPQDFPIK